MAEFYGRAVGAKMPTLTNPGLRNDKGRRQFLLGSVYPTDASVQFGHGGIAVTKDEIADHESCRVVCSVLAGPKSPNALLDVFVAQSTCRSGDTLAFNDRVRVVFTIPRENLDQHYGNVGPAIRYRQVTA